MSKISFNLDHVLGISIDDTDLDIPKKGNKTIHLNLLKPKTKVILTNTQPIYIDPDMVGYIENDELRFEK